VTDPDATAAALATSLGIPRTAESTVVESIVTFLTDKHLLLLLDNCEHLLISVRRLLAAILRGCPRIVVLATSRERLAIQGEHVLPVAPLPLSEADRQLEAGGPAAALFIDRARAVRRDLQLDAKNRTEIADICRHVDGLPLALELAAARMRSLNPADIAERVRTHLDLLSSDGVNSGRHGTLRTVLDWSYGLLGDDARQLFDRMSVFAGSFDLAAAEVVCSGRGIERRQVVDLVTSLVDASMITVGGTEGAVRYSLLETLRRYGAEHLSADLEAEDVRRSHAQHFVRVAEQADQGLRGPEEAQWVKAADLDLDNFRTAHRWMTEHEQVDLALRLSRGLRYYMLFRFRDEVVT
jgi:predicted ATPase